MKEEYLKAFSEVEQIIKLMPESLQNKIPDRFKNIISTEKSQSYIPNIKEPFEECNIMEETKIILAVIYRDFLCSEDERKQIKLKDSQKLMKYEKDLKEKYNKDNLFKNKSNSSEKIQDNISTETALVAYKEKTFLQKLVDIITHLFRKK